LSGGIVVAVEGVGCFWRCSLGDGLQENSRSGADVCYACGFWECREERGVDEVGYASKQNVC